MTDTGDSGLRYLRDALRDHATRAGAPLDLHVICEFAGAHLDATVAVSLPDGVPDAIAFSAGGPTARVAEELQLMVGEGPSMEGFGQVGILLVDDLTTAALQTRWPLFAPEAVRAGIGSLCVIPMRVGAARFGVFAVYFDRPAALTIDKLGDAVLLAAIGLELLLDQLGSDGDTPAIDGAEGLDPIARVAARLLDDHPEIHQATGMVSVQMDVDLPSALLYLRARAFADGRLLSELAADVVNGAVRFQPDDPGAPP